MPPFDRRAQAAASLACLLAVSAPAAAEPALGAGLPGLIAYAREHNPQLRALALEAGAAAERVASAGALPDPRVQLELMDFTNEMNGRSPSLLPGEVGETRYRVIQPLPYWGKRELRAGLAEREAQAGRQRVDVDAVALEARIKSAYARYYQAHGRRAIQRETLGLLEALERLVLTRYGHGLVPQQDAVRAQAEITAMRIDLVDSERMLHEARARVNAALPRDAEAELAEPRELAALPAGLALGELSARARERSPALALLAREAEVADAARAVVYRERYPDFALGLANNRPRNGSSTWELMVELNIPLQQASRRGEERAAERRVDAAAARIEALEASLNGRLGEALAAYRSEIDKARLLRDTLLPQARATLEAAESGYETGRVNFNTLIEAERQILNTRLALLAADVEARVQLAEIEQLVGEAW